MDPKHQFAAQYVLSRAAAERRERESILAAVTSASSSGLLGLTGMGPGKLCYYTLLCHDCTYSIMGVSKRGARGPPRLTFGS